ncbi:TetR/AcrR family transcriptional regulator [Antricoccus suffuscus]|uniref:TetR/AcrR family transcriptional regulator n=1 Tax=Antricoccus suffuscus TaxID=1629062 RepID=UPI0014753EA5|nr:TetR/AcrR family transcriptional regulator [Antricoccus suffuscus]
MSRQKKVGAVVRQRTRARVLAAAEEEFTEVGYVAATVARIAARAGVTVQSIYSSWGSKSALFRAYLESAIAPGTERVDFSGAISPGHPREVVSQIAHLFRAVAERSGPAWRLYRDAAAVDPEIAADWQQLQMLRRGTFDILLQSVSDRDLRVARPVAVDSAWAIASPDMYELLVERATYTLDAFEKWVGETIAAAVLRVVQE